MMHAHELLLAAATLVVAMPAIAAHGDKDHVRVELIAEKSALVPGERTWVGLRLVHEPHWHTYWVNPGDSGLPTKLKWQLPANVKAGDIAWPAPQRFDVGGLFNIGYRGDVVLPVPLKTAADAKLGTTAPLSVEVRWLVCREECVPGKKTLKLALPVAAGASVNGHTRKAFAAAHAAQPLASTWTGNARLAGGQVEVTLSGADLPSSDKLDAFVVQNQLVAYAPPKVARGDGALMLTFDKSEYLTATPAAIDLVLTDSARPNIPARSISVPFAVADATNLSATH
jgi:thiol:disulfide interchange protein DsbD